MKNLQEIINAQNSAIAILEDQNAKMAKELELKAKMIRAYQAGMNQIKRITESIIE